MARLNQFYLINIHIFCKCRNTRSPYTTIDTIRRWVYDKEKKKCTSLLRCQNMRFKTSFWATFGRGRLYHQKVACFHFFTILLYKENHHPISMVYYNACVRFGWIAQSVMRRAHVNCFCIVRAIILSGSIPRRFNYVTF